MSTSKAENFGVDVLRGSVIKAASLWVTADAPDCGREVLSSRRLSLADEPLQGLPWDLVAWRLPLPLMHPTVGFESADGDRFVFAIDVKFPLIGQLIHYRSWPLKQGKGEGEWSRRGSIRSHLTKRCRRAPMSSSSAAASSG